MAQKHEDYDESPAISRRDFVKVGAAITGVAALLALTGCKDPSGPNNPSNPNNPGNPNNPNKPNISNESFLGNHYESNEPFSHYIIQDRFNRDVHAYFSENPPAKYWELSPFINDEYCSVTLSTKENPDDRYRSAARYLVNFSDGIARKE